MTIYLYINFLSFCTVHAESCPELVPIMTGEPAKGLVEEGAGDEFLLTDDEVYAWKELRLHPLLIQSMQRLGFSEPTPIQKACIPAAAHQGKVGLLIG